MILVWIQNKVPGVQPVLIGLEIIKLGVSADKAVQLRPLQCNNYKLVVIQFKKLWNLNICFSSQIEANLVFLYD